MGQMNGSQLIDKSIAFHDPNNQWSSFKDTMYFTMVRPDNSKRNRKVYIDNKAEAFDFYGSHDSGVLHYQVKKDKGTYRWNGSNKVSDKIKEEYRISNERAVMYRDYYTYLYGMPMKLKDSGTIVHDKVERVNFFDKTYDRVRITYKPEVGEDIWYFYFNVDTHAMEAYQFFHDEEANDGEYIFLTDMKNYSGLKIPRIRAWYTNKEDKLLGTDILQ